MHFTLTVAQIGKFENCAGDFQAGMPRIPRACQTFQSGQWQIRGVENGQKEILSSSL